MDEWKGIDDLLSACRRLHQEEITFDLTLAGPPGTAGDETVLNDKIREFGLTGTVRYVGAVYGHQKSALLASADAYVQPSHYEGMPIAMLEALSFGLPVVATRVGAVPEMITEGHSGLLVPPHRPDLLAQAMKRVASNTACRRAMSYAARALAHDRFSTTRLRRDLLSLYHSIMADRGRPTWEPEPMPAPSSVSRAYAAPEPAPA
jgi:glycosyltransferase involved in cell wall biosynthesis